MPLNNWDGLPEHEYLQVYRGDKLLRAFEVSDIEKARKYARHKRAKIRRAKMDGFLYGLLGLADVFQEVKFDLLMSRMEEALK